MKVGLYFGSFNPIHVGHIELAKYLLHCTSLDEIWFVVSPQNPLKQTEKLLCDDMRLAMVRMAVADVPNMKICDVEFHLSKPSYTIDTLTYLSKNYPSSDFTLIIGSDNVPTFNKWKNYLEILKRYSIIVYPRQFSDISKERKDYPQMIFMEGAPLFKFSSTEVRENIRQGKNFESMVDALVFDFIQKYKLYR